MFDEFGINAGYVEELHARYRQSPQGVDEQWREFFDDLDRSARIEAPRIEAPRNEPLRNGGGSTGTANGHARPATPSVLPAPAALPKVNGASGYPQTPDALLVA